MHFTLITLFDQEMERSTFKNWSFPKCFYSFIYIEQFNKNTQYNDKSICLGELTERSICCFPSFRTTAPQWAERSRLCRCRWFSFRQRPASAPSSLICTGCPSESLASTLAVLSTEKEEGMSGEALRKLDRFANCWHARRK